LILDLENARDTTLSPDPKPKPKPKPKPTPKPDPGLNPNSNTTPKPEPEPNPNPNPKAYDKTVYARLVELAMSKGWECFKNAKLNKKRVVIDALFIEKYPISESTSGQIMFDFLEPIRHQDASESDLNTAVVSSVSELLKVLKALPEDKTSLTLTLTLTLTLKALPEDKTRAQVLSALCKEFSFFTEHLPELFGAFTPGVAQIQAASVLFGYIIDWEKLHKVLKEIFGPSQYSRLKNEVGPGLWDYHRDVPAGRYRLNLARSCDVLLLEKMKTQARARLDLESAAIVEYAIANPELRKLRPMKDTSQHGNREPFRNES